MKAERFPGNRLAFIVLDERLTPQFEEFIGDLPVKLKVEMKDKDTTFNRMMGKQVTVDQATRESIANKGKDYHEKTLIFTVDLIGKMTEINCLGAFLFSVKRLPE